MRSPYVAISGHGFGHLAQTAAVLDALGAGEVDGVVVVSPLDGAQLRGRLSIPFRHLPEAVDCGGLRMHDALRVDRRASLEAYRAFHAGWQRRVDDEARRLEALKVDGVFSNVAYLPLAAARRVGLPGVAMCSLNWADIFRHYLGHEDGAAEILVQIADAYAAATVFLRCEPAMPMHGLAHTRAIPPVCQPGNRRVDELRQRLAAHPGDRLVLFGLGGVAYRPPLESWPPLPGLTCLIPDEWGARGPGFRGFSATGMTFRDLLASVDVLVTKPGYGSYVEAAVAGLPVLTLERRDWPESVFLNAWLERVGHLLEIPEAVLHGGALRPAVDALLAQAGKPAVVADGAAIAARLLADTC